MFKFIDNALDRITMYRLLLYYLIVLVLAAMALSGIGILHFSALSIGISTVVLVIACWFINEAFAAVFQAPTNTNSAYITALILALIITPMTSYTLINFGFLLAASGLAMASKYVLTINKKHVFNPAAIAIALTALGPRQSASWWVGTTAMLPLVLIGGTLLVRRIRRGRMVISFFTSTLLATILYTLISKGDVFSSLDKTIMSSAMFFLGFVMLTEPVTTPPTAGKQTWYAVLTGILFPPQFHILSLYSTPELALIASNVFSYIISPKTKLFPTLQQKIRSTPDSVDFVFDPNRKFKYKPGQYMEWTLPHHGTDRRGNRRYFTLASSPTEQSVRIGVKFYQKSSSYKKAMLDMTPSTPIVAAQPAGDFTLPKDTKQKLVFIAGGIGITPYRSMIKYLLDTKQTRNITLLYSARTQEDFAYKNIFEQAEQEVGLKVVYVVTGEATNNHTAANLPRRINAEMIRTQITDYRERLFYVSGTHAMVTGVQEILKGLDIPKHQIKVDFFSGYA